jgi:hypothetical protein
MVMDIGPWSLVADLAPGEIPAWWAYYVRIALMLPRPVTLAVEPPL